MSSGESAPSRASSRSGRKTHWEGVYRDKSPLEVSWYQLEPQTSLDMIDLALDSPPGPDGGLIDVGGGASVLVDRLLARGWSDIAVLDLAGNALAHAKRRLDKQSARVRWIEADVTDFLPPKQYRIWHDRAVFHFLTDAADREAYVQRLMAGLVPDGHVIIAAFAPGGPTQCSGLDIVQYDAVRIKNTLGPAFDLEHERQEVHLTPAGKEQLFGYFLLRYRE
ncbi:methyltransferase domain-containing protein [Thiorhodovibrio winogradskyi]|uniref:methyltransferase domain-containing protein n=2 Tax=Thiorhodovibrio TaxID=61593 RepID=UPI0019127EEB